MSAAVSARTTALAIHAVAQHMIDRRLPAPMAIDAPSICPQEQGPKRVAIRVYQSTLDAWLDSMLVDEEHSEPLTRRRGHELVTYVGRIPSPLGDVAVEVLVIRQAAALSVLPGGVA